MHFICEFGEWSDYLAETEEIDFSHPAVSEKANEFYARAIDEIQFVKDAYEFVRDKIAHSWDIQSSQVTRIASEVLSFKEGICYAKANLLCALLRSKGVPAGFCYQRLTLGDTPDTGYCIHALNAVFINSIQRWIRLDARGNKPGVQAEFSLEVEKLAFPVRTDYNEVDYAVIYKRPNRKTMQALKKHSDCLTMYLHDLPEDL